MSMLTPASLTNSDKRKAKRDIINLIDGDINTKQSKLDQEKESTGEVSTFRFRELAAMVQQRNTLAREYGLAERKPLI